MQVRVMTTNGFSGAPLLATHAVLHDLPCQGLNETTLLAAHFDAELHSRVHAVAADGTVASFSLPGEMRVASCRCVLATRAVHARSTKMLIVP